MISNYITLSGLKSKPKLQSYIDASPSGRYIIHYGYAVEPKHVFNNLN